MYHPRIRKLTIIPTRVPAWFFPCCFILFLFVNLPSIPITSAKAQTEGKRNVLILNSYHPGYKWTDDETQGAIAVLDPVRNGLKVFIEYMDTKWVYAEPYFEQLRHTFKYKFQGIRFDVIIATDDDAFNFLKRNRAELFPNTPVVFCGVNWFKPESVPGGFKGYTGVNEDADIPATLDLMVKLHPKAKKVYVVNDTTTTGKEIHAEFAGIVPKYKNRVSFTFLENMDMSEILATVGKLGDDGLVLFTLFQKDKSGNLFEFSESTRLIAKNSTVPCYGLWDFNLGYGIVGGMLTNGYSQGRTAGKMAMRILEGEKADAIPVLMRSPNRFMFDYEQLQRWKINRSALPADSDIINEPPSFYEVNKSLVWGLVSGLAGWCIFIVILLINSVRRKNVLLATQQETSMDGILVVDESGIIISCNQRFIDLWEIPLYLVKARDFAPLLQAVAAKTVDPAGYKARVRYLYEEKEEKSQEEVLLKDGRVFDRYSAPMRGDDGKYFGRVWYFRDITGQKQAEEERKAHIRFLKNLELVDQAIKQETDVERMLRHILETVFSIFDCDRAWLLYPCDPDAPTLRVPMEICRPDYPGAKVLNVDLPMAPDMARDMREALESDAPVIYTAGTERPVNKATAEQFGVQSQMFVPLYPRSGKPWVFGMHQCSYPRIWTKEEAKLFTEIARRISDGVSSAIFLRELQENEERFRSTFEQAAVGIAHVAPDGRWLRVNQKLCDIVGYSREEMLRMKSQDITHPADLDASVENARRLLAGESSTLTMEKRYIHKDGSPAYINLTVSVVLGVSGDPAYLIAVIEDIAKRREAEESLLKSEAKYRELIEGTSDLVTQVDAEARFLYVNHNAETFFGCPAAACIGRSAFDFVHPDDRARTRTAFQEWVRNGVQSTTFENRQMSLTGEVHELLWTINFHYDGNEILQINSIARDISEQRKLQNEQHKSQKLESLGVLAGGIAHDFNNILTGIMGNISFARMFLDESHRAAKILLQAEQASKRATNLAHQLLTFAKGSQPIKKLVSARQVVEASASLVLSGSNVLSVVDIPDDLHDIEVDEGQINQAFNNIIINAAQAMPGGGSITIKANNLTLNGANAMVLHPGAYVRFTFTDTGCGIPEEDLKRIFDPYFTTKVSGNGLGLASVHSIISKHGGHISVRSKVGGGTTFDILLPASNRKAEETETQTTALRRGEYAGCAVLVMDDEEIIRNLAAEMLGEIGCDVQTCSNGEEAITLYKAAMIADVPFAAVIMDLTVPGGMGGKEAAEHILALDPAARLIVSSGYSNDPIMAEYARFGFRAALAKPYMLDEIVQVMRKLMLREMS